MIRFAGLLGLAVCAGCVTTSYDRPYDTLIECPVPDDLLGMTPSDAESVADMDGDGILTELDARWREGVAVVALEGVHELTGQVADPGFSVHSDFDTLLYAPDPRYMDGLEWSVQLELTCLPHLRIAVWFQAPDNLEEGTYEVDVAGVDVYTHEMGSTSVGEWSPTAEGVMHITEISSSGVSGYFDGSAIVPIVTIIPYEYPTGQSLLIEALAFHDVPVVSPRI